jgi:hypothetical protein
MVENYPEFRRYLLPELERMLALAYTGLVENPQPE